MFGIENEKKLTPDVSLELWLKRYHVIDPHKRSEMYEEVDEDVLPLNHRLEVNRLRVGIIGQVGLDQVVLDRLFDVLLRIFRSRSPNLAIGKNSSFGKFRNVCCTISGVMKRRFELALRAQF